MEDVVRYLQYSASDILLIVDQMNALETSVHPGNDSLSNDMKKALLTWIYKITAVHQYLFSSTANYTTRLHMDVKQTNETKLFVYGGFSPVSPYGTMR
jgi:phosphoribosylformylglycinamidine (FGAM) synthase-like enzyme